MTAEWAACPSQPIQPISTNQKTLFATVNLSLMHFIQNVQIPMNLFCVKIFKTNCNVTPYDDQDTERVNAAKISAVHRIDLDPWDFDIIYVQATIQAFGFCRLWDLINMLVDTISITK
jgi:hypothetical protein